MIDRPEPSDEELLASIAQRLYEVGSDLLTIGPDARSLLESRLGSLPQRLLDLHAELARIQEALSETRAEFVRAELEKSSVAPNATGLKLHLGSGQQVLPSWLNVDVFPAQFRLNLSWGLPFAGSSVDYVFFSHVLEHLYYPGEVRPLLREIARVLRPGGIVRIIVPDVEKCIRAYTDGNAGFFETRKHYWPWAATCRTRLEHFLEYSGANQRPSAMWQSHKFGYDFETLALELEQAGFGSIVRSDYMQSEHPELRVDHASTFAGARHGDQHYSLFVEATR